MKKSKFYSIIAGIVLILCGLGVFISIGYDRVSSTNENNKLISEFDEIVEKQIEIKEIPVVEINQIEELELLNEAEEMYAEMEEGEEIKEEDKVEIDYSKYDNYTIVAKMEIPSIDLVDVVVEGESLKNLKIALGHFKDTPLPGGGANFAVCGHNGGRYGVLFDHLEDVKAGDMVTITLTDGTVWNYEVKDVYIVEPTDFSILDQYDDGIDRITLMTCTPGGKQRIVVRGELAEEIVEE